ncbi:MAG: hypothetical protein ACI8ZM_001394 [Crocinitomix sp.]|jgi:hypothetical protein
MYKILVILCLLTFSANSFSQKIKIKDDIATVDGEAFLNFDYTVSENSITISSLTANDDEIYATYLDYNDPKNVTSSNPQGTVRWIELNFLTLGLKCEVDSHTKKSLVKFIIKHKLYVDGFLNKANVTTLISKFGMRYSENRPNGNVTVIINN